MAEAWREAFAEHWKKNRIGAPMTHFAAGWTACEARFKELIEEAERAARAGISTPALRAALEKVRLGK